MKTGKVSAVECGAGETLELGAPCTFYSTYKFYCQRKIFITYHYNSTVELGDLPYYTGSVSRKIEKILQSRQQQNDWQNQK